MTILLSFLMPMPCMSLCDSATSYAFPAIYLSSVRCHIMLSRYLGNGLSTNNRDVDVVQQWLHHVFFFPLPIWKPILTSFRGWSRCRRLQLRSF